MRLEIITARRHGLEVWLVRLDGRTVGSFLSEAGARTKFKQLLMSGAFDGE